MPKTVDVYVLDTKIGSGQFGDVFKGYNKVNAQQVAIKTIRRDRIKGKFTQLLENQIKVLKSCNNNNIVRLIDIKKTSNNIYLILEYCNEGDLAAYLKKKKRIPESEAVEYFVQILHAFETLVKDKIMHRDFKLPNVLKHNGVVKIADFGFAKLLGSEDQQVETILGSPLNMAPEVLNHQAYNSKADIWSIGVGFYEMVFGKMPYVAKNIVDLIYAIKNNKLQFPFEASPCVQDVLKKMLVVDSVKRISWNDLFSHPVTRMLQDELEMSLNASMVCQKEELPFNIFKFYIRSNKIISNIHDVQNKQQLNAYLSKVIHQQKVDKYEGAIIKRKTQREHQEATNCAQQEFAKLNCKLEEDTQGAQSSEKIKGEEGGFGLENSVGFVKDNLDIMLGCRNRYAFLGQLAEKLVDAQQNAHADCLSFLLLKNAITDIRLLRMQIQRRDVQKVVRWEQFEACQQYHLLLGLLKFQQEIYNQFFQKVSLKVLQADSMQHYEDDLIISGKFTIQETNARIYRKILRAYLIKLKEKYSEGYPLDLSLLIKQLMDVPNCCKITFDDYYNNLLELATGRKATTDLLNQDINKFLQQ